MGQRATQTDPNCELTMPDEDAYMPRLMGYVSFEFNYSFYDIIRRGYTRTASAGMLMPVDIEFSLPELCNGITAAKRARCTRRRRRRLAAPRSGSGTWQRPTSTCRHKGHQARTGSTPMP